MSPETHLSPPRTVHELAFVDELTGLPNRAQFRIELDHQTERYPGDFALLFIDLDDLKKANDTQGHKAGDTLIQTAASKIDETAPPRVPAPKDSASDTKGFRKRLKTVAATIAGTIRTDRQGQGREDFLSHGAFRLAGDEFVVIAAGANTQEKVDRVIERVELALDEQGIKASIGGRPHRPEESGAELLHSVDQIMYKQKQARKKARKRQEVRALPLHKRLAYEVGKRAMIFSGVEDSTR